MTWNWLTASILAALFFGIFPIFGNKAGQMHGEKVNFILDAIYMLIISVPIFFYGRQDFYRITPKSFSYSLGLALSSVGFLLTLYAWRLAPSKLPVIGVTVAFSTVITAVIAHFMGMQLDFYQWIGVLLAFCGIVLVNMGKNIIYIF